MKESKKQNKKRRKLRTLILLLFLTIIMLGTSTYAWFTANRTVTIQDITVNVQTSDGLQISTDGKTWKSTITTDDIETGYTGHNNFIPNTLDAVSTTGAVTASSTNHTRLFNMYASSIDTDETTGNYTITTTQVDESTDRTKFVAFDIFLRVSADKDVYINSESGFSKVVPSTTNNTDRGLKNAARVGFVPVGEAASDAALNTILNAYYESDASSVPKIWEPNNDTHSNAVINSVSSEYTMPLTETGTNTGLYNPLPYYGITSAFSTAQDLINTVKGTAGNATLVDTGTATTTDNVYSTPGMLLSTSSTLGVSSTTAPSYKIFRIKAGITKMRVYMWVEGQDLDCENNASGTDITFHIELTIPKSAPASSSSQG